VRVILCIVRQGSRMGHNSIMGLEELAQKDPDSYRETYRALAAAAQNTSTARRASTGDEKNDQDVTGGLHENTQR